jgi:hypothetical protein
MKAIVIGLTMLFSLLVGEAVAECLTQTITGHGRTIICTTCCYGPNNCSTQCY